MASTLFFPAAIEIDNQPLTDQGRAPVQRTRDERSVLLELASGKKKKYVKAIKNKFNMDWSWLPDSQYDTIDGGLARTKMKELLCDNAETHTLRFYDRNGGYETYTVFVTTYNEELHRRDARTGTHFWNITIEFEEQ